MGGSSFISKPTNYKQIRNKQLPTKDYESSARNGEVIEYNSRGDIEVITASDVAEMLKISKWMVYELVRRNEIPHFKVGRSVRFIKGEVVRWALN